MKNDTPYCVYCGYDVTEGHHEKCPLVAGIPKAVWGAQPKKGDGEFNLHLGRYAFLFTIRKGDSGKLIFGTANPKTQKRLLYEYFAFLIRRKKLSYDEHYNKKDSFLLGRFHKKRLNSLDKEFADLKKHAKEMLFPKEKLNYLMEHERALIVKGAVAIPLYRDGKGNLIYEPINE